MRNLITAFSLIILTQSVIAQPGMGGMRGGGQQMNGRFYGKLIDSKSGKPVEYASVQLIQNKFDTASKSRKDMVIAGMLTKANGEFSLENVPLFGQYKLKATAIGFTPIEQKISFDLKMPGSGGGAATGDMSAMLSMVDKDLGNLKMDLDAKQLENVTVSSSAPGLKLGIDRKVFNVDKNIVSAGGTAIDVMRNVPSLNVDIDGNVTMRNNTPQLFVDGRPTNLTLEQIPADAIQSVELITNPSAKFDASGGTSGILNIVLKKEKKVGYNGSLRANLDSRARIGVGGDINLRQQKVNMFVSGMYNQRKSISTGTTERLNMFDNPNTFFYQTDKSIQEGSFAFVRAGVDYFINNRNTLSVSGNFVRGSFKPNNNSDILIDTLSAPKASSFNDRQTDTKGNFRNIGTMISFKHNFPKAGRELTADVTINKSKNENNSIIQTDYYTVPQNQLINTFKQQQQIDGKSENITLQTDYTNPITDKSKVEVGVRAQLRKNSSKNAFYYDNNGQWILQPSSQIDYESNDQVYAAYATYSNQLKSFGYQLGLRAESSDYEGKLLKTSELFNIDFPISLFPSVFLSQKLGETQSLQLNYSRRINRPNFWQLTPFTDSSDRLNPSKGNPGLKPEFTNSFELSYEKTFKNKGNFLASIYYKHTTDLITRYQVSETGAGGEDLILNTYINANSSYVTGIELTSRTSLYKWWEITPNFNLYTSDVKISIPGEPDQERLTSYFLKLNNSFKLPKNITIQLSGEYQSKTVLPPGGSGGGGRGGFGGGGMMFGGAQSASQGYIRPNYGVDIAVRYEFLKNRAASVSVNMNDILRTRRQDIHSESSYFSQDLFRRRDPQILRVNFNWRFGKFDPNLFKRKNLKNQGDGGATEGMNMGQ
ncbi:MAG: TonB-dependent receptor [Chitinophagaceae bacterium]|nr:TonB-dependent receptor [Chitinophagaceae bacterium]